MKKWANSRFVRYTASSLASSVAEEGIYVLLTWLLGGVLGEFALALIPMVVARGASGLMNFWINRKLVFKSDLPLWGALGRYTAQAVPVAVMQFLFTYGFYAIFHIGEEQVILRGVIYAGVMVALFVVGFAAQKMWVFRATEKKKI